MAMAEVFTEVAAIDYPNRSASSRARWAARWRHRTTWSVDDVLAALLDAGVPAAEVVLPERAWGNPRLHARGFLEPVTHAVVGTHALPSAPVRFSSRDGAGWLHSPAPTLGQHNRDVLEGDLGLEAAEADRLEAGGVIGTRPFESP